MIRFVSISTFRAALDALLKVKRGVYAGVSFEICNAFKDVPIEQIRANRDMILMDSDFSVIKLRLPDKKQRLSKSDGYRLIYMVMKNVPVVAFLTIYPKRGPMHKVNLEESELAELMNTFTLESKARQIVVHDIDDSLKQKALP
jgi:mRNA-degrading endonuclease RelE of RelBE toxin-antitoxin system